MLSAESVVVGNQRHQPLNNDLHTNPTTNLTTTTPTTIACYCSGYQHCIAAIDTCADDHQSTEPDSHKHCWLEPGLLLLDSRTHRTDHDPRSMANRR